MTKSLLLGAWMTALFWPFPHAGGYIHPAILALTPFFVSAADYWQHWTLRALHWILVFYGELSIAWGGIATPHWIGLMIQGGLKKLMALPVQDWNQVNAHLAAPLLLLGGLAGWLLFRQCRTYGQALALWVMGALIIPINHVLWRLPGESALAAYLIIGLGVLLYFHSQRIARGSHIKPPARPWYAVATLAVLAPLLIGWSVPGHPAQNPLQLFPGTIPLPGLTHVGSDTTGYGTGVTQIGHSLIASRVPVMVVHTVEPHYWQAAVYTHFNGTSWSNQGSITEYHVSPSQFGLPLVPPSYRANLPTVPIQASFTSLTKAPLTTLFYSGVPTYFSVPVTIHSRSQRFISSAADRYTLKSLEPVYNLNALAQSPYGETIFPAFAADLQTPGNLSPKVAQMARRITRGTRGPWEAAIAVKRYLDSHYRYSYHVTPTHHNVVNHFLFVDRQGYCDQFSTTFIMMMRSLGVPARWVVGYGPGTYDTAQQGYLIRAIDAHSWAEVWIQGDGWVPFDPTPGWAVPLSSNTATGTTPKENVTPPSSNNRGSLALPKHLASPLLRHLHPAPIQSAKRHPHRAARSSRKARQLLWPLLGLTALATIALALAFNHARMRDATAHERLWRRIMSLSRRHLGTQWHKKSPRQWGQEWLKVFPDDSDVIRPLVTLLEASFYRGYGLTREEEAHMIRLWQQLRLRRRRSA